eukprot:1150600-Pelagomonas_calceolata.AAC.2
MGVMLTDGKINKVKVDAESAEVLGNLHRHYKFVVSPRKNWSYTWKTERRLSSRNSTSEIVLLFLLHATALSNFNKVALEALLAFAAADH